MDKLHAYATDRLDPAQRTAFEARLARDPHLAADLAVLQAAAQELGEAAPFGPEDLTAGWARLDTAIAQDERTPLAANSPTRPSWLQATAMAAAAVLAWQVIIVPFLGLGAPAEYIAASEAGSDAALRVAFAPDATQAQIAELLEVSEAQITAGPSAIGLYTLSFEDTVARDAAEQTLAEQGDLILTVSRP